MRRDLDSDPTDLIVAVGEAACERGTAVVLLNGELQHVTEGQLAYSIQLDRRPNIRGAGHHCEGGEQQIRLHYSTECDSKSPWREGECVQVFRTKVFDRFVRRERIADEVLIEAIDRAERGLVDADLGGGVIKLRVARPGQGRSGGYRAIVLLRAGSRAVFAYGFAKSDRSNISRAELDALRALADELLNYDEAAIEAAVEVGALIEVIRDDEAD